MTWIVCVLEFYSMFYISLNFMRLFWTFSSLVLWRFHIWQSFLNNPKLQSIFLNLWNALSFMFAQSILSIPPNSGNGMSSCSAIVNYGEFQASELILWSCVPRLSHPTFHQLEDLYCDLLLIIVQVYCVVNVFFPKVPSCCFNVWYRSNEQIEKMS